MHAFSMELFVAPFRCRWRSISRFISISNLLLVSAALGTKSMKSEKAIPGPASRKKLFSFQRFGIYRKKHKDCVQDSVKPARLEMTRLKSHCCKFCRFQPLCWPDFHLCLFSGSGNSVHERGSTARN